MSRLYLHCGLCGRKQADGLLSRTHWGHVDVAGGQAQACPTCKEEHADWDAKLRASAETSHSASAATGGFDTPSP